MNWIKKLHWQIIIGLVLGFIWGIFAPLYNLQQFTADFIKPVGTIFIKLLQLVAMPLVIASLIVGIGKLGDIRKLSRIGGKTIGIFVLTTTLAISIGLVSVNLIKPGEALPEATRDRLMSTYSDKAETREQAAEQVLEQGPLAPIVNLVPDNFINAASSNTNMLQVLLVAVLFGVVLLQIPGQKSQLLFNFFDALNDVIMKLIDYIMLMAPYGAFALIASIMTELAGEDPMETFNILSALALYCVAVVAGLLLHLLVVYSSIVKGLGNTGFIYFMKQMRPAFLVAFSTSSSNATLPVTMDCVTNKLKVKEEISSFVLPLGATVNMDGTSLYQAVAAVFIAQALGLDLTFTDQLAIILTATLASIGTAGVPGAGIVMLVIVLKAVDVPVEGIALILGVDRILDMIRTVVNISGDAAVSLAINRMEECSQKI
ncbi:MAG TPA: dicarboxylate/amino acid:cation symporter [Gracilimonas sp.]|uniref:dicarboxylate/amino acid:cation symporter n=1 Tax=Gracilimonas sp. TaxID=1974203 RepID=UPI002DB1F047|nr:dicarboxylate/amino acid:cation symporter [Gracilimonas sp.]